MSEFATKLLERRKGVAKQAEDLASGAVAESRDLTGEEQASFDKMISELENIDARLQAFLAGEQRARDIEASFTPGGEPEPRGGDAGAFGKWAREARVGESFELPREMGSEQRAIESRGRHVEQRVMSATGGVGPSSVYSRLWEYAVASSQILQAGVFVLNTSDGNTLPMPRVTAHATGATAAAGANITASDATLDTVDLGVVKRGYITYVPSELVTDTTFDLEGYIARAAGRELGRLIGGVASAALIAGATGVGATGPTGTASGTFGAQASANQGGDLFINLFHSVLPEYRTGAAWLMSDTAGAAVRKIKTADGQYIWERALQVGDPIMIEGKPVYYDSNLPSFVGTPATDSGKKLVYFGDLSALAVRIAGGLRFERSAEAGFGNDTVAFRALVRTGAAFLDVNAVKHLVLS